MISWRVIALQLSIGAASSSPSLWPLPQSSSSGELRATVASGATFRTSASPALPELDAAFERLLTRLFPHGDADEADAVAGSGTITGVDVTVAEPTAVLQLSHDESYELTVPADGQATLTAQTVFGAYHGLETLAQLVAMNFTTGAYEVAATPWQIQDAPRFAHRGLLVDSGRHFEPVPVLLNLIDSMAMSKLNVMHWHLTEDQSFPLTSRTHPEFAEKGAWSSDERYTWGELKRVVEYSRARGIRVVPEFDMPGHATSWQASHPEIFTSAGCKDSRGALDPANEKTFEIIGDLLKDWAEVFTDDVLHLGTDEVPEDCWTNSVDQAFMREKGFTTANELFNYFIGRIHSIAAGLGKRVTLWDEAISEATPPTDAIIEIWRGWGGLAQTNLQKAVQSGHDAIYAPDGPWYLDATGATWEKMYAVDPVAGLDEEGASHVLGGEACMWGEHVDPSDLESTVWPRLAAVAERLWSPKATTASAADAEPRLQQFRCTLLARGVRAGLVGADGRAEPPGPGGCAQGGASAFRHFFLASGFSAIV